MTIKSKIISNRWKGQYNIVKTTCHGSDDGEHDVVKNLQNILICRHCGEIGGDKLEELATTQSLKQAHNILGEMALTGDWTATDKNENGLIYTRTKDGVVDIISVLKKGVRQYQIIKETKQKGD